MAESSYQKIRKWNELSKSVDDSCSEAHHKVKLIYRNYLFAEQKIRSVIENLATLSSAIQTTFQRASERVNAVAAHRSSLCRDFLEDLESGDITEEQFQYELDKLAQLSFDLNEPAIANIDGLVEKYGKLHSQIEEIFPPTAILVDLDESKDDSETLIGEGGRSTNSGHNSSYAEELSFLNLTRERIENSLEFPYSDYHLVGFDFSRQVAEVKKCYLSCPGVDEPGSSSNIEHPLVEIDPLAPLVDLSDNYSDAPSNGWGRIASPIVDDTIQYEDANMIIPSIKPNQSASIIDLSFDSLDRTVHPDDVGAVSWIRMKNHVAGDTVEYVDRNAFTPVDTNQDKCNVRSSGLFTIGTSRKSKLADEFVD